VLTLNLAWAVTIVIIRNPTKSRRIVKLFRFKIYIVRLLQSEERQLSLFRDISCPFLRLTSVFLLNIK